MEKENTSNNKPSWLLRLEQESWQAELLISGAAIFGSMSLPGLLREVESFILETSHRDGMMLWYMVMTFANFMSYILIITFITHFAMRTLWIGMVSFNSAHPEGFIAPLQYSENYRQKLQEEFGDINVYIFQLDKRCSTIFGSGFAIALTCFGYVVIAVAIGIMIHLLDATKLGISSSLVLSLMGGVVVLYGTFNAFASSKWLRDKPWVEKWHFPIVKTFGKVIMNMGYWPASYVLNITAGKTSERKYGKVQTLVTAVAIGLAGAMLGVQNMNVDNYIDTVYHRSANNETKLFLNSYADTHCDCYDYHPVIPSYEMYANELLTVFMPLPNREKFELKGQCLASAVPEGLPRPEERIAERERYIACAKEYYTFYINDEEVKDYDIVNYNFGTNEQEGFLVTFSNLELNEGKNVIRTLSNYFNEDGEARIGIVPFYYHF